MIRRLIILLLIVGCEEPDKHGCLDSQATNYDSTASIDNNSCTFIDSCGVVDIDKINDCVQDCAGEWGGMLTMDCAGECSENVELWNVCYNIENTTHLELYDSGLTGEIPPEIGNLTNLTYLSLGSNQLTGEIPVEIGKLTNLTWLDLRMNELAEEIPSEIGQLTNLTHLYLDNNQLTGEIPHEVCDLMESNNLINMDYILTGNNLTNTCD